MMIYDITDEETFDALKRYNREIEKYKNTDRTVQKIVIGNKCDLEKDRNVSLHSAQQLCQQMDIPDYMETAAVSGENIETSLEALVTRLVNSDKRKTMPFYGWQCLRL